MKEKKNEELEFFLSEEFQKLVQEALKEHNFEAMEININTNQTQACIKYQQENKNATTTFKR